MKTYANDTENQIIQKKQTQEADVWITHINYISEESELLLKICSEKINSKKLFKKVEKSNEKLQKLLPELYSYRSSIKNINECEDLECDLFYLNRQDEVRDHYFDFVNTYRILKKEVLAGILSA